MKVKATLRRFFIYCLLAGSLPVHSNETTKAGAESEGRWEFDGAIGDFGPAPASRRRVQIIDERPVTKDFRDAPVSAPSIGPPQRLELEEDVPPIDPSLVRNGKVTTRKLKEDWARWHRGIDDNLRGRLKRLDDVRSTKPMKLKLEYEVTKDLRIVKIRFLQMSDDTILNKAVSDMISRMQDDTILKFPAGWTMRSIKKTCTIRLFLPQPVDSSPLK